MLERETFYGVPSAILIKTTRYYARTGQEWRNSSHYLFVFQGKPALAAITNESEGLFICNGIHGLHCFTYGHN